MYADDREIFDLCQLMYCSLASQPLESDQEAQLFNTARKLNQMDGITGVLMQHEGVYVQFFEGPLPAVQDLWKRLLRDKRHYCVVKLLEKTQAEQRACPDWAMRQISHADLIQILREADLNAMGSNTPWGNAIHLMRDLLEQPDTQHYIRHRSQHRRFSAVLP